MVVAVWVSTVRKDLTGLEATGRKQTVSRHHRQCLPPRQLWDVVVGAVIRTACSCRHQWLCTINQGVSKIVLLDVTTESSLQFYECVSLTEHHLHKHMYIFTNK